MKDEMFDIKICNSENDFIHNYGVNRGYVLSYNKIDRCLFLSSQAKQLYRNISQYAYGDKHSCYPCQASLRLELGWSKDTLTTYIRELEQSGLIVCTEQGANRPLVYNLIELHKVPLIIHSEIVYSLKPNGSQQIETFKTKVSEYTKSELYQEVLKNSNPEELKDKIVTFFNTEAVDKPPVAKSKVSLPNAMPDELLGAQASSNEDGKGKTEKAKGKQYSTMPVESWKAWHFCHYFADLYKAKTNQVCVFGIAERGGMNRIIDARKDNEYVKTLIDSYISLIGSAVKLPSIMNFTSSYIQSLLDTYIRNGSLPDFIMGDKKGKDKQQETPKNDVSDDLNSLAMKSGVEGD